MNASVKAASAHIDPNVADMEAPANQENVSNSVPDNAVSDSEIREAVHLHMAPEFSKLRNPETIKSLIENDGNQKIANENGASESNESDARGKQIQRQVILAQERAKLIAAQRDEATAKMTKNMVEVGAATATLFAHIVNVVKALLGGLINMLSNKNNDSQRALPAPQAAPALPAPQVSQETESKSDKNEGEQDKGEQNHINKNSLGKFYVDYGDAQNEEFLPKDQNHEQLTEQEKAIAAAQENILDSFEKTINTTEFVDKVKLRLQGRISSQEFENCVIGNAGHELFENKIKLMETHLQNNLNETLKEDVPDAQLRAAAVSEIVSALPDISAGSSVITDPVVHEKIQAFLKDHKQQADALAALRVTKEDLAGINDDGQLNIFAFAPAQNHDEKPLPFPQKTKFPGVDELPIKPIKEQIPPGIRDENDDVSLLGDNEIRHTHQRPKG